MVHKHAAVCACLCRARGQEAAPPACGWCGGTDHSWEHCPLHALVTPASRPLALAGSSAAPGAGLAPGHAAAAGTARGGGGGGGGAGAAEMLGEAWEEADVPRRRQQQRPRLGQWEEVGDPAVGVALSGWGVGVGDGGAESGGGGGGGAAAVRVRVRAAGDAAALARPHASASAEPLEVQVRACDVLLSQQDQQQCCRPGCP